MKRNHGKSNKRGNPLIAGVTLIELLVALTLLGLISTALLAALSSAVNGWRVTSQQISVSRNTSNLNAVLHSAITSLVPYRPAPSANQGGQLLFFQGDFQVMCWISTFSPRRGARSGLRLLAFRVVSDSSGVHLILSDKPCPDPQGLRQLVTGIAPNSLPGTAPQLHFMPVVQETDSMTLAENLSACNFRYLRKTLLPKESTQWVSKWTDRERLPLAVQIEISDSNREGLPGRLRHITVTSQIPAALTGRERAAF